MNFDPNSAAQHEGIFGLPYSEKEASLIFLPVPWEATTSYGGGTSKGPKAILEASYQVDLYDLECGRPYEAGYFLLEESKKIRAWNKEAKTLAQKIIAVGGDITGNKKLEKALRRVNELSQLVNQEVENASSAVLEKGKILALIGGDHASPLGALHAIAKKYKKFGILHIDAHSDTRKAYEGFTYSHASIMYNALEEIPGIQKIVQVGIRDFCEEEMEYIRKQGDRMNVHFDLDIARRKNSGDSFAIISESIIEDLPENVWVSFDIDGLDPRFCPHTGTPVPGGIDFHEALKILHDLARSGKKIIGFDLNEVAPGPKNDEWDANVGARLLYKMAAYCLVSQGKAKFLR